MRFDVAYVLAIGGAAAAVVAGVGINSVTVIGVRGVSPQSFVNWENSHTHPLDTTPNGELLLAVNTADNRLEVFDITTGVPVSVGAVPVGLDPVSVRARSNTEAWVVNHVSDSVSVVDLSSMNVVMTVQTGDEPSDVVFAGAPESAFVTCSQTNLVQVFDPTNPAAPTAEIPIIAEEPRAMAVSPDGMTVYAAVWESGNRTTILGGGGSLGFPQNVVNNPSGPHGGVNPPPNNGAVFKPPVNGANPAPLAVGLIVQQQGSGGAWVDDTGADWSNLIDGAQAAASDRLVGWTLVDNDVAIIDATALSVTYAGDLANICMAIGVNPASGEVSVVGTDAINEIRYEPVLNGRFLRVNIGTFDPLVPTAPSVSDLNPHLTYTDAIPFVPIAQTERDRSIGDPRSIVWNTSGTLAYVAGMGSNNVVVIDASGARAGLSDTIEVGEGPTGLALDEPNDRLYVLNRFEASISVIDTATELELGRVSFFDPTPTAIQVGRLHLYDTHKNSGLGYMSCASCHIDARMDALSWDLGDPAGSMKTLDQNCPDGECQDWHPMKGPMVTQTLQNIIGLEPHHWRGDKFGIEDFNGAFISLLGDDTNLSAGEMQEFEDFLATISYPPNPNRNFDNTLPTNLSLTGHFTTGTFGTPGLPLPNGDAQNGLNLYRTARLDGVECVTCHTLPVGVGPNGSFVGPVFTVIPDGPMGEKHHSVVSADGATNVTIKIPQLRNMYEKTGFNTTQLVNTRGTGYLHDGSVDSVERFIALPVFSIGKMQQVADLSAFMLAFGGSDLPTGSPTNFLEPPGPGGMDTHAAVGRQTTLVDLATAPAAQIDLINDMVALSDTGAVGLVVKGIVGGEHRGYTYIGAGSYQSDRTVEIVTHAVLTASAAPGSELTFTLVPDGSQTRIGTDRDDDGHFDTDETDACADPADPFSTPLNSDCCVADLTTQGAGIGDPGYGVPDGLVTGADIQYYVNLWIAADPDADLTTQGAGIGEPGFGVPDGQVTGADIQYYVNLWVLGCP